MLVICSASLSLHMAGSSDTLSKSLLTSIPIGAVPSSSCREACSIFWSISDCMMPRFSVVALYGVLHGDGEVELLTLSSSIAGSNGDLMMR